MYSLTGHFYRGEMDRTITWRTRLDQTTNWAVIVIAALLTWVFSGRSRPHYVLLVGMLITGAFLLIEANRYREYDVWRRHVRTLQEHLFARLFTSEPGGEAWKRRLGEDLENPSYGLTFLGATAHRLRRVYLALFAMLLIAWVVRVTAFEPGTTWQASASIPGIPGPVVAGAVAVAYLGLAGLAIGTYHRSPREFRV